MGNGEEDRKSKGVFGVWDGFAFDGFRESIPLCKRSAQVDELGVVASEGEVGVEEENAHEQSAQAQRGQKIGFAFVLREVKEGGGCLFLAFFVHVLIGIVRWKIQGDRVDKIRLRMFSSLWGGSFYDRFSRFLKIENG